MLAVLVNTAASGFVLSGALRAPVAQQAVQMADVGAACTGTCKWFDSSKGFGFIAVDGEESDIFVHQSEIYAPGFRSLADGEKVEFKVSADDRTGEQQSTHMFTCRCHELCSTSCSSAAPVSSRRAWRPPLHRSIYLAPCSLVACTSSPQAS
jgi:cold shock CspA family protein